MPPEIAMGAVGVTQGLVATGIAGLLRGGVYIPAPMVRYFGLALGGVLARRRVWTRVVPVLRVY